MGDATPSKSSIGDDDEDDNKSNPERKLKNDNESITNVEYVALSENDKTKTSDKIPEVSSNAAEESINNDRNNVSTWRRISQGSNFSARRRRRRPVFFTFRAHHRPRQPFFNQNGHQNASQPPRPPSYYTNQVTPERHRPTEIRAHSEAERSQRPAREEPHTTQPHPTQNVTWSNISQYQPGGIPAPINPFFFNFSYWAPYPENVPSSVQPCLAHLYKADSLFIVQQINFFDMMFSGYFDVPNFYFIQNKNGQIIYYVYETTNQCLHSCCGDSRGFQLHVMDMYNNEIIYMNRPCGCTGYPCCYPVMEVYSPPLVPVGAIMQVYNAQKNEFAIVDADENLIFRVYGPLCFNFCCCCLEVDFTIHALDKEQTEVGVIRREWGGFVRTFLAETDMFGITFPEDLDVRIKGVFLGVLFFIEYLYFGDA